MKSSKIKSEADNISLSGGYQKVFNQPAKKLLYTKAIFEQMAPKYYISTLIISLGLEPLWKHIFFKALPKKNIKTALDLACGTGEVTFKLRHLYPSARITGADISPAMLKLAEKKDRNKNIQWVCSDIEKMNFKTGSLDLITGGYALGNAADLQKALTCIYKWLTPSGIAVFLDFRKPDSRLMQKLMLMILKPWTVFWSLAMFANRETHGYIAKGIELGPSSSELILLMRNAGFKSIKSKMIFPGLAEIYVLKKTGRMN